MNRSVDDLPVDLATLCLERAVRRLRDENHEAAVADLRAALRYMQHGGADPVQVQHLASIIADAEQRRAAGVMRRR